MFLMTRQILSITRPTSSGGSVTITSSGLVTQSDSRGITTSRKNVSRRSARRYIESEAEKIEREVQTKQEKELPSTNVLSITRSLPDGGYITVTRDGLVTVYSKEGKIKEKYYTRKTEARDFVIREAKNIDKERSQRISSLPLSVAEQWKRQFTDIKTLAKEETQAKREFIQQAFNKEGLKDAFTSFETFKTKLLPAASLYLTTQRQKAEVQYKKEREEELKKSKLPPKPNAIVMKEGIMEEPGSLARTKLLLKRSALSVPSAAVSLMTIGTGVISAGISVIKSPRAAAIIASKKIKEIDLRRTGRELIKDIKNNPEGAIIEYATYAKTLNLIGKGARSTWQSQTAHQIRKQAFILSQPRLLRNFLMDTIEKAEVAAKIKEARAPLVKLNFYKVKGLTRTEAKALDRTFMKTDSLILDRILGSKGKPTILKDVHIITKTRKVFLRKFIESLPKRSRKNYHISKKTVVRLSDKKQLFSLNRLENIIKPRPPIGVRRLRRVKLSQLKYQKTLRKLEEKKQFKAERLKPQVYDLETFNIIKDIRTAKRAIKEGKAKSGFLFKDPKTGKQLIISSRKKFLKVLKRQAKITQEEKLNLREFFKEDINNIAQKEMIKINGKKFTIQIQKIISKDEGVKPVVSGITEIETKTGVLLQRTKTVTKSKVIQKQVIDLEKLLKQAQRRKLNQRQRVIIKTKLKTINQKLIVKSNKTKSSSLLKNILAVSSLIKSRVKVIPRTHLEIEPLLEMLERLETKVRQKLSPKIKVSLDQRVELKKKISKPLSLTLFKIKKQKKLRLEEEKKKVEKLKRYITFELKKNKFIYIPDLYSRIFSIKASSLEKKKFLRKGALFTGLEARKIIR